MTGPHRAEIETSDDEEYRQACDFRVFWISVGGAVVGYLVGAESGFTFWPNSGLAVVGMIVFGSIAYRFRKVIAIAGAALILIAVVAGIVEGIMNAK